MKIEINTEAELDIDAIAEALNSHIDSRVEDNLNAHVDTAVDVALDNYDFRDIVRDEVNDMDISYEIDNAIDDRDDLIGKEEVEEFENRIEALEQTISTIGSVIPNKALDASLKANEELSKMYSELVEKCKHFIGVTEPKEETESSDQ